MNDLVTLLEQGVAVMCIGMGTVLTFLCVMIVSMFVMGKVVRKLNELFPVAAPQTAGAPKTAASNDDENIACCYFNCNAKGQKIIVQIY